MLAMEIQQNLTDLLAIKGGVSADVAPHTFFLELAEMGALYDFLITVMKVEFRNNQTFRNEMLKLLIKYPSVKSELMEKELLFELQESLNLFLYTANQCHQTN